MSYLDVGRGSEPYDLFVFAINAEQTREKYISRLKKFLETIGIDQEHCKIFANKAMSENGCLVK
jgi:hypothetical protein